MPHQLEMTGNAMKTFSKLAMTAKGHKISTLGVIPPRIFKVALVT